jgi:hypothetical protein
VTLNRPVPPGDPQGERMWAVAGMGTAPNLSTPRLKVTLWGPPDQLTLSLGKPDVWDRRIVEEPVTSVEDLRRTFAMGEVPKMTYYPGWNAHDFPCPKPVGQVILLCADLAGAPAPEAVTHCADGSTDVALRQGQARARLTYVPLMDENVIAIEAEYEGLRVPPSVRLYRHRDTCIPGTRHGGVNSAAPEPYKDFDYDRHGPIAVIDPPSSGQDGECFWIRQVLPADKTFPNGFAFVLAARVLGAAPVLTTLDGQTGLGTPPFLNPAQQYLLDNKQGNWRSLPDYQKVRAAPGSAATATLPGGGAAARFTVLVTVVTQAETEDPLAAAKARLAAAAARGFQELRAGDAAWFNAHYERREQGRIFRGSAEFARAQIPEIYRSWRNQHHSSACLTDPSRYEADTTYAWLEVDWANWHGIPCYNELFFTHAHVRNRSDRLSYFYNLLDFWWPASQQNARECLCTPGAAMLHGYLPPIKPDRYYHCYTVWEFCLEIPAQVLKVLWDCYDYGGNEAMLAAQVYPKLRDVAECYRHYVTPGADGRLHIVPTVVAEYYPWNENMSRQRDTTSALCMFRWMFQTAAEAAGRLGVDPELRTAWRRAAERLAPYPMFQTPEGPIYSDIPGWEENRVYTNPPVVDSYNYFPGYYPCLLADEVNLDSPPRARETMLRTARLVRGWLREVVPILLGVRGAKVDISPWAELLGLPKGSRVPLSTWTSAMEWTGMEREDDVAPDALLNSRGGRMHLFPAVESGATVAFRDFQARGGFLVSAECVEGTTTFVRVCARREKSCRLMNPWPGRKAVVRDEETGRPVRCRVDRRNGECLHFTAQPGRRYVVQPG